MVNVGDNLNVDGKIKATGDVEDGAGNKLSDRHTALQVTQGVWTDCAYTHSGSNWNNLVFTNKSIQDSGGFVSSSDNKSITFNKDGYVNVQIQGFVSSPSNWGVGIFFGNTLIQAPVTSNFFSERSVNMFISAGTTITFAVYGDTGSFHNYNAITSASILFIPKV